jgi:hypothetical protein
MSRRLKEEQEWDSELQAQAERRILMLMLTFGSERSRE